MKLFREVGLASSTLLVIGNIIGVGIFTTSGLIAQELGNSPWLIGIWLLGGFLALIGSICYSRLAVHVPRAGGEYAFLYPFYGPLPAFLSGWVSLFIGFSAPIAAVALGLAHYLEPVLPLTLSEHLLGLKGVATGALLCVSLLLSLGLNSGVRLHSAITLLNFGLTAAFALLVLRRAPIEHNLGPILHNGVWAVDLSSLGSAVVLVMFTYSGWNAAAYLAEEIRKPKRNIPAALILGTVVVMLVYLLINIAYFSAAPLSDLQGKVAVAEIAASRILGPSGGRLVNVIIVFSICSSLTAMSIAGPRVYFAMSRDGLFPDWLCRVHERKKIPLRSMWFQSAVALVFIWLGSLYQILLYSGFILLLFSTLTVSVLFQMHSRDRSHPFSWLFYRVLPALFVTTNGGVLLGAAISNPLETLAGIVTVALGLPVYWHYKKKR